MKAKPEPIINLYQVGEAAAVANMLRVILRDSQAKDLDAIAHRANIRGEDLIFLASSVCTQLDAMYKAITGCELT
jgi:hypothetical protein